MAELTIKIKPDDVVEHVIDEVAYKGKTIREWADLLTNPKSNADRIRAMSDEELAGMLSRVETDGRAYGPRGKAHWLNWLQSPAGGEENVH